jgi:hypothetical protein
MNDDLRKYNGGARDGAGRPKTVSGKYQMAVRLPEDMARWIWRQRGSDAEVLRRLVREAMERETANEQPSSGAAPGNPEALDTSGDASGA